VNKNALKLFSFLAVAHDTALKAGKIFKKRTLALQSLMRVGVAILNYRQT